MRNVARLFAAAVLLTPALPNPAPAASQAAAAPADDFRKLQDDYTAWLLRESPTLATSVGVRDHDAEIADIGLAAQDRRAADNAAFLKRLEAVPDAALSPAGRVNKAILKRVLSEAVEANGFGQRTILFNTFAGWHQDFADLADTLPFAKKSDYQSYLTRIAQYPKLNDTALAITQAGLDKGHALSCAAIAGQEKGIIGVVADDPAQSRFYAPFLRPRPADASEAEWSAMQARAKAVVTDVLNPAYRKHHAFFTGTYLKKCAQAPGFATQPGGADYYAFRVRQETTTDLTPDAVHKMGLEEVARIGAEMDALAKDAGFPTRAAFVAELRSNPKYFAKTPEEMLEKVARVTKLIDAKLPSLFGRLPRLTYGIRPIPPEIAEGTVPASYSAGSIEAGVAGMFNVNTSRLDQRPLWELPALSVHDIGPGHHQQTSLQNELDLPRWRRFGVSFNAFSEGWGLYAERLGIEMGIYDTPEKNMGRLSYEMWRAARLVVDTGLHAKGWSKERAIAYMRENTALSDATIGSEVNRYMTWPAQALGYKFGEIKIRALRAKAEKALGGRFDLRRFHDAVLAQGTVPLDVLERQIDDWIAAENAKTGS